MAGATAEAVDANGASATPYDRIVYPSGVFARIDPDRLGTIARLHGIAAAPAKAARVLEIGGGEGLNLTAFAAAFPGATCLGFDLAETAVARGQALARAAGLGNVRIERMDAIDAAETLPGEYDYIIAHGVYAWVPERVRRAVFALIGRVLAPDGVAMVSYNALPGAVLSQTLRDMVRTAIGDADDEPTRIARSIAMLRAFGAEEPGADPFVAALRTRARLLATRPEAVLAHDEFGACFAPQTLGEVCAVARTAGLAYLNDAVLLPAEQGFPDQADDAAMDEAALVRSLQVEDYRTGCQFRHSLFVRGDVAIGRRLDAGALADLWLASTARMVEQGRFLHRGEHFELGDTRMCAILMAAERRYPERLPLAGLDADRLEAFARLFLHGAVTIGAERRAAPPSARPRLSPLARAQIERGDAGLATLDQTTASLSADMRRFMLLLDGDRDVAALAQAMEVGVAEASALIGFAAQNALLIA